MKNKFLLAFLGGTFLFTSCLKDDNVTNRVYGPEGTEDVKIVEIHDGPDKVYSFDASSTAADYDVLDIRLNAPASSDITVTLALDQALIDDYNAANGTSYAALPASVYTLNGLTVTIPKGSYSKKVTINMKSEDLIAGPYALGLKLSGTSDASYTVSGNYNSFVAVLGAKNKYDGIYNLTLSSTGWAAYGIADGPTEYDMGLYSLITAGGATVEGYYDDLPSPLQPGATSAGAHTAFGATTPVFVFDPATDKLVNVYNSTPDDGRGRTLKLNPAVTDSRYDPATKTVYASIIMTQNGRPDQYIYETLEYVGPRP
jgi:BT_3987-like, N-terminal domain